MPFRKLDLEGLLSRYVTLLGLPIDGNIEINLRESLGYAASAILLVGIEVAIISQHSSEVIMEVIRCAFLIILFWVVFSSIFVSNATRNKSRLIAINVNVASFWLAVTSFFVLAVLFLFPDGGDVGTKTSVRRFVIVAIVLVAVPIHILRCRIPWTRKAIYVPALWATNGYLAWIAVET